MPTCLITGATSGIGLATAEALAGRGYTVVGVGRDPERCSHAQTRVDASGPTPSRFITADLSSLDEVRSVADELGDEPLDLLINNVGAMFRRRSLTVDGLERTFALNHLGPFLLTHLLLDNLRAASPSRVVNLSSVAHRGAELDLSDLEGTTYSTNGWPEYQHAKLANILFTRELQIRVGGHGITTAAVHPGIIKTGFARKAGLGFLRRLLLRLRSDGLDRGIATVLHVATAPDVEGMSGLYWADLEPRQPAPPARDPLAQSELWRVSLERCGLLGQDDGAFDSSRTGQ